MNETTNLEICKLMAENGNMKKLLSELLPDMESYVKSLTKLWPGRTVLTALHKNEAHLYKIKEFITDFEINNQ